MEPMKQELKDKDIVYLYITFSTSPFDDWKAMVKNIPGEHYYLSPEQFEALDNLYQSGGAVPTYAIYNTKTGQVDCCNAGHNPPLLLRRDGSVEELLRLENPMLGIFEEATFKENSLQMEPGDTLVMFTDGVTEAWNAQKEELGVERLKTIVSSQTGKDSRQVVEAVKAAISDFVGEEEQSDDITMLVINRK